MKNNNSNFARGSDSCGKHLTLKNREDIESFLDKNMTFKEIAKFLQKDPSTISKEIKLRRLSHSANSFNGQLKCDNFKSCSFRKICLDCNNPKSNSLCKTCPKCVEVCCDFVQPTCKKTKRAPFVCNGCPSKNGCRYPKYYYRAKAAHNDYLQKLSESRQGIALNSEDFYKLADLVSPLIKKGQSIAHISFSNADGIKISNRTIYNYVEKQYLYIDNIDMPRKVKFKKRKLPR